MLQTMEQNDGQAWHEDPDPQDEDVITEPDRADVVEPDRAAVVEPDRAAVVVPDRATVVEPSELITKPSQISNLTIELPVIDGNQTSIGQGTSRMFKIKQQEEELLRRLASHKRRLAEMQASARKFLPRVHDFFDDYSFIEDDMSWPVPKHLAEVELEEERSRAYRSAILKIALVYALPSALLLTAIIVMAVLLHLKCRRTDPQPQPQPELGESGEVQEMIPLAHDQDGGSDLHAEIMDEIETLDNALRDALSDDSD